MSRISRFTPEIRDGKVCAVFTGGYVNSEIVVPLLTLTESNREWHERACRGISCIDYDSYANTFEEINAENKAHYLREARKFRP